MFAPETKLASAGLTDTMSALLDAAIVKDRDDKYNATRGSGVGEVAKKRIGSGYIGLECDRALAFKYHRAIQEDREGPVNKGELQRHAESGHWTEGAIAGWLRLAGFELHTHKPDGRQYGYTACIEPETGQARMAGEIDGVILAGPIPLPYPVLWESKKATDKKYTKFAKGGVKKADARYYGQLQNNHVMMSVPHTLFTMLNLDTMKFYIELVGYDAPVAQWLQDRAARVIESSNPYEMPRITGDPSDFRCKFCDYARQCWNVAPFVPAPDVALTLTVAAPEIVTALPSWLN